MVLVLCTVVSNHTVPGTQTIPHRKTYYKSTSHCIRVLCLGTVCTVTEIIQLYPGPPSSPQAARQGLYHVPCTKADSLPVEAEQGNSLGVNQTLVQTLTVYPGSKFSFENHKVLTQSNSRV
mmetsp:Transcript_88167/g.172483  ORF Transcript_88167/g.172483 Transcript_88167/m.172483 type:complete len:121 (-) Transcript_88167:53-415(-)